MRKLTNNEIKQEIVIQNKLFSSLKKWLTNAMILSTLLLSVILMLPLNQFFTTILLILFTLSILASLLIGFALKRGHDNLQKLLTLLDEQ